MIKNYKRLWSLTVFTTLVTFKVWSQPLSGNYTIDNTSPVSSTNFTSFTQFASTLNAQGVATGGATVTVNGQSVYTEQIEFNNTSMTATNAVTINGNGRTLTFASASAALPHTMLLSGADYMTFNNLFISGTGGTYALTVHLWNGANNNTFNNCRFDSPIVGTVTTLVPFSISGSNTSATSSGLSGSNNTVNTSTLTGGYYGSAFYGNSITPFDIGNSILNSRVIDFYQSGCYNIYCQNSTFKGNIIERQNRLTVTTTYGIICTTGSMNSLVDGNHIRKLFNGITGSTSLCYPIYILGAATIGNENIVRNNLVSDINSNGTIVGIFLSGGSYAKVFHNTVSLDDATATAGLTYGIQCTMPNSQIRNNIITIGRGGSGAHYGMFFTTAATNLQSDFNDIFISSISGSGNLPFFLTTAYTLSQWQLAFPAFDQGSKTADPVYTSPAAMNYVPTTTVINNMCPYIGVNFDITGFARSLSSPDPGAYETFTTPCAGSPPANSVITPSYVVCPNTTLNIALANTYTNTGYTVQWQSSTTSSIGPYTAISGATLNTLNTGLLSTTIYYNAVITCVNGGTTTASAGIVSVAQQTISNVPYYEDFEGISLTNQLPNCSWYTPPGGSARTYTTNLSNNRYAKSGTKYGSFVSSSAPGYFYSNGINLKPGITYSAALWYVNEAVGYYPWNEISILIGTSQTTTGLTSIVSSTAATFAYNLLSNTFTVSTAGVYYLAIRAVSAPGSSPHLSWDDLSVTIPCQLNSPQVFVNSMGTTICANQSLALNAIGADAYMWTSNLTGTTVISTNAVTIVTPSNSTTYYVTGTNTLSGCTNSTSVLVTVLPAPPLALFASSISVCEGQSTSLSAQGADTYNWSNGAVGTPVTVTPTTTTSYTVIGVGSNGCSAMQTIVITVNPNPTVTAVASSYKLCKGGSVTLTGSGATSYKWSDNASAVFFGSPLVITVQSSGGYTMTGTNASGCSATAKFVLDVDDCTGIDELGNELMNVVIYPNPTSGTFKIAANGAEIRSVDVLDVTGRTISSGSLLNNDAEINISQSADGVYFVKVTTTDAVKYFRIVKAH